MDPIEPLITALHAQGRLRVWSLVITVFGDMVQHRGGRISTTRLQRLLGRIGVEPGALRTALSRLGRDGWVESERSGRASHYRLSQTGLARFTEATSRIYAPPRDAPVTTWTLALDDTSDISRALRVGGLVLRPADQGRSASAAFALSGQIDRITDSLRGSLLTTAHTEALQSLLTDIGSLEGQSLDPLDAAAARILLVHRWRRIVLRYPDIPAELLPADLGPDCPRTRVARAYVELSDPAEAWLDSKSPDMAPMPKPSAAGASRFLPRQKA